MDRKRAPLKPQLILPVAILVVLLSACSGGNDAASNASPAATATSTATASSADGTPAALPIDYASQLGDTVWQRVQASPWYDDGSFDSAGTNLMSLLTDHGPLWRDSDSLALLDAYPDGIPDETLSVAKNYARMTLRDVHEVILDPWLADGIDDYERAIMATVSDRTVSVSALRQAMEDGLFRQTYEEDPSLLTAVRIDAMGSLSPHVLELLKTKDWFNDGIDSYEASLLGVINTLLSVTEQINVIESDDYQRLPLSTGDIAVVYFGDPKLDARAQEVASAWMDKIEAFVGEFRPIGLVIDTTPISGADACHTGSGGGNRPGRISLPAPFCFQAPVIIHELTHAFVGGNYPTWFTEGVAELVAYHLTGARAGYLEAEGTIELNSRYVVLSGPYTNQAGLGARFLVSLYDLAGADQMSSLIKDVAGRTLSGDDLLARIRQIKVDDPQQLDDLINRSFGFTPATSTP